MTTGERIKAARKKAKMIQAALGFELGVSGSMVAQYETGVRNPKYKTLERIAEKLGVSVSYLQGLDDEIADALEALREQELARNSHDVTQACEWISVEERLPEDGNDRVLVHLVNSVPQGGKPKIDTDRYLNGMWVRWNGRVTHWMPLPEPPTEGGDSDGETKPVVTRCSLCKTPIYIKVKRHMKPVLAPLTREQELRDRLVDMTGEDYAELSGWFCPGCGRRKEGGGEG